MRQDHSKPTEAAGSLPAVTPPAELDAHGFDPADYKWVPVLRRPRKDGWTPERQVKFITALADGESIEQAALQVGMSVTSCYRLRSSPGGENFAAAWDSARACRAQRLVDVSFDRAIHGTEEPVFDRDGRRVGHRIRYHERTAQFILRAYLPERFRYAHKSIRHADEEPPPEAEPLGEAIRRLEPVPPENPQLLMPPDELETELQCADILQGELPRWYRGAPLEQTPAEAPLGEDFERRLEAAKRAAAGLPPEDPPQGDGDEFLA